jgi:hypothetical protein
MDDNQTKQNKPHTQLNPPINFHVNCRAAEAGLLEVGAEAVSFVLAQRIRLKDEVQLWDSLQVYCHKETDGSLAVQVIVWSPKLEEALQIALLRSWPDEISPERDSLGCDLTQKPLH